MATREQNKSWFKPFAFCSKFLILKIYFLTLFLGIKLGLFTYDILIFTLLLLLLFLLLFLLRLLLLAFFWFLFLSKLFLFFSSFILWTFLKLFGLYSLKSFILLIFLFFSLEYASLFPSISTIVPHLTVCS